jgi:hypothetical protein
MEKTIKFKIEIEADKSIISEEKITDINHDICMAISNALHNIFQSDPVNADFNFESDAVNADFDVTFKQI